MSGTPTDGICIRGREVSEASAVFGLKLGEWRGWFPLWGGSGWSRLVGSGKLELFLGIGCLRCLFEIQVEKYGVHCAVERELFNSSPIDGYLGGFQVLLV